MAEIRLFETIERFYPPKGLCEKQNPYGVHLIFFPFYCGLEQGVWQFQTTGGNSPFWNPENVLSPKGLCEAEPEWGPFDSFHFIVSKEGCFTLSI